MYKKILTIFTVFLFSMSTMSFCCAASISLPTINKICHTDSLRTYELHPDGSREYDDDLDENHIPYAENDFSLISLQNPEPENNEFLLRSNSNTNDNSDLEVNQAQEPEVQASYLEIEIPKQEIIEIPIGMCDIQNEVDEAIDFITQKELEATCDIRSEPFSWADLFPNTETGMSNAEMLGFM